MRVLLEPRAGGEGLAALGAGVAAGAHVVGADVALQVGGVGEDLVAVLAGEAAELAVHRLVAEQVGPPRERLGAVVARVLVRLVAVALHHVLVQPEGGRNSNSCLLAVSYVQIGEISLVNG